jgi:hypothetical protein
MKMSEHTPGPWEISYGKIRPARPIEGYTLGYAPICIVRGDKRLHGNGVREANARLIAAAPELLEALKDLEEYVSNNIICEPTGIDVNGECFIKARAAIAKAEGKQ